MNLQAMMKKAQQLQKEMIDAKQKIDDKNYNAKSGFVEVSLKGNKKIDYIKINADSLEKDDIEALEDMIKVAMSEAMEQIDKETEEKLGKYTQGMPGIF